MAEWPHHKNIEESKRILDMLISEDKIKALEEAKRVTKKVEKYL